MAIDIARVRTELSKAPINIKQKNVISATQALRNGINVLITQPLMKAEQEEFAAIIDSTCKLFTASKAVQEIFPIALQYTPGQEKSLLDMVTSLLEGLESDKQKQALEIAQSIARKKQEQLEAGQKALEEEHYDEARETFTELVVDFPEDAELKTSIAEKYMGAALYDDAADMFQNVLSTQPDDTHVLNRLGIALRKIKKYESSEKYFRKAIGIDAQDPNLFFNLGRLYFDQKMWAEAVENAEKALGIAPEFVEAAKLCSYCKKQLEI